MHILIFGGTTEGRLLAESLIPMGHHVTVSCATEQGIEEMQNIPCRKCCGRLDALQMQALFVSYDLIVDATHPYAKEASRNIQTACENTGKPLRRIVRPKSSAEGCLFMKSCHEAAEFLRNQKGNILIATGAKELSEFSGLPPTRLFARVLPTKQGLEACESLGLPHRNILALEGPFSRELNEALMKQYQICWMVTKDGGAAGGFPQKLAAARNQHVQTIVIDRPEESGMTMEEFLKEAEACTFH